MSDNTKSFGCPTPFNLAQIADIFEVDLSDARHLVTTVEPCSVVDGVSRWYLKDVATRYCMFKDGHIPNPAKFTAKERMEWNAGNVLRDECRELDVQIENQRRSGTLISIRKYIVDLLTKGPA